VEFDKNEILKRSEIVLDESIKPKYLIYEGEYPKDQFWDGGVCYVPVRYMQVPRKLRVYIKRADCD